MLRIGRIRAREAARHGARAGVDEFDVYRTIRVSAFLPRADEDDLPAIG